MKALSPQQWDEMRRLMNFLHNNGIPIGIGTNTNNHTIFELYLPLISRPDGLVGPTIGITKESRVGNLYFIAHDAVHHVVGIPGPRLKDLDDLPAARKKLFEIMLLKEQIATLHSMSIYIPAYWNWRDKDRHGRDRPDFVDANHGLFSFGDLPQDKYVDMIGHFVHGRSIEYGKILGKYIDPKTIRNARRIGVPLGGPNLYQWIGLGAESWFYKLAIPIAEPILARYREVGYLGFKAYSQAMADFMLQPWYVEWADRFKFGVPLDELYDRAKGHIEDQKAKRPLGDEEKVSEQIFERRALMNEVALFGRRVAELREMGRIGKSKSDFNRADDQRLGALFEASVDLHEDLAKPESHLLSSSQLEYLRGRLSKLMSGAERLFPLDSYLPHEYRQAFISYKNYWRDITGLLLPRYGHNSSALSTTDMQKFISDRRDTTRSYYAGIKWKFREWLETTQFGKPDFWNLQNAMADDYEQTQKSEASVKFKKEFASDDLVYLHRLDDLSKAITFQIKEVLLPQIIDSRQLNVDERRFIIEELLSLINKTGIALSRLEEAYGAAFLSETVRSGEAKRFMEREMRLNVYMDRIYAQLFKLAQNLQLKESASTLNAIVLKLRKVDAEFHERSTPMASTASENIPQVLPNRHHRAAALFDATKALLGRSADGLVDVLNKAIIPFRYMRPTGRSAVRFAGWDPRTAPQGPAHFILHLNHDQGLMEINMAYEVFETMGVERIYTLTTKKAWGYFPKGRIPGENVVYIEDDKPIDQLVKRIQASNRGRIGIMVCPEGILPSMYASMPIAAKPGAFVLARKLAAALKGKIPVYSIFGIFNGHEHFTSDKAPPLTLNLEPAELVPTDALSPNDSWVQKARRAFENLVNIERVVRQPDLNHARRATSTNFAVSSDLKPHTRIGEWFNGNLFSRCGAVVRNLKGLPDP